MTIEDLSSATTAPTADTAGQTTEPADTSAEASANADGEKPAEEAKPEKTAHEVLIEKLEREKKQMQRAIDRRTRQLYEERARQGLTPAQNQVDNQQTADDSQPLSLTRAQLAEYVKAEAAKLAPTIQSQQAEAERRTGVITSLAKTWGQEKFDAVSADLDEAFGGLTDRSGGIKPAMEAIFEADEPAKLIEYLADPDNYEEAERISKLGAVQAGKAIARLEAKLSAEKSAAKPNPKVSKAPAPLEAIRGVGGATAEPDESKMSDVQWAKYQEAKRNKRN